MAFGPAWAIDAPLVSFRVSPQQWSAAIGRRQHAAFNDFVDGLLADQRFRVNGFDRLRGRIAARLNSVARGWGYRALGKPR
jgi:hypothetical protein